MTLTRWVAAVFVGVVLVAGRGQAHAAAESPSTLLEKGIYLEQTTGDLDAAMQIYKQIADDDQANRPLAAQAQYRLGLCQLKKKQSDAAADSFRKVVSLYPDQKGLVARAQQSLGELGAVAGGANGAPPKPARPGVIRTDPPALANDVDPSLDKITVTFNYPMADRSWSWTGSGPMLPKSTGSPSYDTARRVCTLPVQLEPGKVYRVGVNSKDNKGFRTAAGTPVPWYMIVFATRSADGKPTPIPQDLQQQVRAINQISNAQVGTTQQGPPKVVRSVPRALADNVAVSLDKITVTFDQAMLDGNWSWIGSGETYPKTVGDIHYDAAKKTCTLPVKLEPGKVYWVGVNSPDFQNFRAADGTPAARYAILFATESADGKPTPIPQDLLDAAREINGAPVVTGQPAANPAAESMADPDRQQAIEQIFADPEPIVAIANKIFEAIRTADYDRWINGEGWGSFPVVQYYQTYQWYDALVPWICKTFKADPIQDVSLGQVVKNEDGLPAIPYKLTLASGKVMEGVLPFNYKDGRWYARWGLDWHLGNRMRLTEARKTTPPASPAKVEMRVIGKPVSAFAAGDLSTPESAAANYNRASGSMDAKALAAVSLAPVDAEAMKLAFERNQADMEVYNKAQLTATILQVLTYRDGVAKVITKLNFPPGVGRHPFSGRTFGLFNGQWKNMGEDRYPNPQAAREAFEKGKDAIWDDYMQMVEQNGDGGGKSGAEAKPVDMKDIQRRPVDKAVSDFPDKMDLSTPEAACASWMRAWARRDAKEIAQVNGPNGITARGWQGTFRKMRGKAASSTQPDPAVESARIVEVLTYRKDMADVIVKAPRGNGGSYYSCRGFGNLGGQWKNMGEDAASSVEEAEQTFAGKKENLWKYYQGFRIAESKQQEAEQRPEIIEAEAKKFFEAIRTADYDRWLKGGEDWHNFPIQYETYTDWPSMMMWMCKTFKQNPITDVQIGKGFRNDDGLMAAHYKLTLKDGAVLEGDLPFYWEMDHWHGKQGVDWHLKYKNKPLVAGATNPPASQPSVDAGGSDASTDQEVSRAVRPAGLAAGQPSAAQDVEIRKIDKTVSQLPDAFDLSSPEAACASWLRAWARQDASQLALADKYNMGAKSEQALLDQFRKQDPAWTNGKAMLDARIVEVMTSRDGIAFVMVQENAPGYSIRIVGNMHGQWKNMGENRAQSLEAAEADCTRRMDPIRKMYQAWLEADTKLRQAEQRPEVVEAAARKLFENLRSADYSEGGKFGLWRLPYESLADGRGLDEWMRKTFQKNPVTDVQIGKAFKNDDGLMTVPYKLTLKNGAVLKGDLSLSWSPMQKAWFGMQGLDWVSRDNGKPLAAGAGAEVPATRPVDASSPEATIRGFMQAAVAGDVERAMAHVLPGSHDYEDIRDVLTNTAQQGNPFAGMFAAIDPQAPVEIVKVERQGDRVEIAWRFRFVKPWTVEEHGKSQTFKPGETFDLDGNLKKVGDAWLINGI